METRAVKKSVNIHASPAEVWNGITDPKTVEKYFFGTHVESDWKEGHSITYSGIWKGQEYKDKGEILKADKGVRLSHTHWSSLSGLPDEPENYYTVTYDLEPDGENTVLVVTQVGEMSNDAYEHSGKNWEMVLGKLKALLEKTPVNN